MGRRTAARLQPLEIIDSLGRRRSRAAAGLFILAALTRQLEMTPNENEWTTRLDPLLLGGVLFFDLQRFLLALQSAALCYQFEIVYRSRENALPVRLFWSLRNVEPVYVDSTLRCLIVCR